MWLLLRMEQVLEEPLFLPAKSSIIGTMQYLLPKRMYCLNIFVMWFDICTLRSISPEQPYRIYISVIIRMKNLTLMISDDKRK